MGVLSRASARTSHMCHEAGDSRSTEAPHADALKQPEEMDRTSVTGKQLYWLGNIRRMKTGKVYMFRNGQSGNWGKLC
jgi:hypothetical protein